jgi:hypothetical protein
LEARIAESERSASQTHADTEKWAAQKHHEREETHSRFEAKLAEAHTQREQSQGQLAEVRGEPEAENHRRADLEVVVDLLEKQLASAVQRAEDAERASLEMRTQVEQVRRAPDLDVTLELLEKHHATAVRRVEEAERAALQLRTQVEQARQVAQQSQSRLGDERANGSEARTRASATP